MLQPLQFGPSVVGPFLFFRLFGLVFLAVGVLNVVRPREMTSFAIRQRASGEIEGTIEPTGTRILFTRIVGAVMALLGLGIALGVMGP